MSTLTINEILPAIRRLSLDDRRALIERASRERATDNPGQGPALPGTSLIGLMADEPEIVDRACSLVYDARVSARMRKLR